MNTKTMEGLVGAGTNMDLVNTPMRVFKEARRRGDSGAMERAMGYVDDFAGKAENYRAKADEGMKEEAKELRKKERLEQEKALEKRREEREAFEAKLEGSKEAQEENTGAVVEISEEGKALAKEAVQDEMQIGKEAVQTVEICGK